jgi:hypothetical protein
MSAWRSGYPNTGSSLSQPKCQRQAAYRYVMAPVSKFSSENGFDLGQMLILARPERGRAVDSLFLPHADHGRSRPARIGTGRGSFSLIGICQSGFWSEPNPRCANIGGELA